MTTTGFTEEHGVWASDGAIQWVAIILTNGNLNSGQIVPAVAQLARDQCIKMFVFGIGSGINEQELLEIAWSPERVFRIDSIDSINDTRAIITS